MQGLLISIKRHIIFLFLLLLLLFLLWLRFFVVPKTQNEETAITPTQTMTSITPPIQVSEPQDNITPALNVLGNITYTYNGEDLTIPETLSIFTYEEPVVLTYDNAVKLASFYNMPGTPFLEGNDANNYPYFTFKNNDETLILGGSFPTINYIKGNLENAPLPPVQFTIQNLNEVAVNELNRIGITNIEVNNPSVSFYKVVPYAPTLNEYILEQTQNQEEASYVKFSFPTTIGRFPLVSQEYKRETSYVIVDLQGSVYEVFSFIIPPTSSTTTSALPFNQIVSSLNQKAVILNAISSQDINSESPSQYTLSSVDLSSPRIYYYLPSSFSYNINPYLLFNGVSLEEDSKEEVNSLILVPLN